jgi:prepilin-type N-terminal cleavage/methylation domain-containing protein
MTARADSRGFTLIEVVVALAILSISLATVMQIFSGGLKNIHRVDLAHRAMSHGENVMNEVLADQEIQGATVLSGDLDEEFDYTVEVRDFEAADAELAMDIAAPTVLLLEVEVRIRFKNDRFGKFYRLSCLKSVSLSNDVGDPLSADPIRQLFGQGAGAANQRRRR